MILEPMLRLNKAFFIIDKFTDAPTLQIGKVDQKLKISIFSLQMIFILVTNPKGLFPCVRMRCLSMCVKKWVPTCLLWLFPCVRDPYRPPWRLRSPWNWITPGAIFHALRTLRTANCILFNIVMIEFFDIEANIWMGNNSELSNLAFQCAKKLQRNCPLNLLLYDVI